MIASSLPILGVRTAALRRRKTEGSGFAEFSSLTTMVMRLTNRCQCFRKCQGQSGPGGYGNKNRPHPKRANPCRFIEAELHRHGRIHKQLPCDETSRRQRRQSTRTEAGPTEESTCSLPMRLGGTDGRRPASHHIESGSLIVLRVQNFPAIHSPGDGRINLQTAIRAEFLNIIQSGTVPLLRVTA
jgi:hypothetical protein